MIPGLLYITALILLGIITLLFILTSKKQVEIGNTDIPLEKVLPIQNIEENLIINGNGDITAGYKLFLPETFTLSSEQAEKIFKDWEGVFKMLPAGTIIHQQNFYYEGEYHNSTIGEESNFIHKENLKYYQGKPILHNYTHLYITFAANSSLNKDIAETSLLRKPNYPFKQPYKEIEKRLPEITNYLINFENGIKGIDNYSLIRMSDSDLNTSIFNFLNSSYNTTTCPQSEMVISPISIASNGLMKIGDKYISILSLAEEGNTLSPCNKQPKTPPASIFNNNITVPENIKAEASMIYPLGLGLPINHVLNITIEITDTDNTVRKLKSESAGLNALAVCYAPAKEKQECIKKFCKDVIANGYQTAYTAVNVILYDNDINNLQRKISLTENAFMNMNHSKAYVENYDTANLFFTSIPGNARANYRGFVNTTVQALSYFCKEGLYISDSKGYIFLDRFGCPCVVDLWDSPYINNRNGITIGPSGTGKSYLLNLIILQSIVLKFDTMIVDIGGSYRSLIKLNRGKYFDSQNIESFSFNPFLCKKEKSGKYIYDDEDSEEQESSSDRINLIASIVATIWKVKKEIEPAEWILLKKSITRFYDFVNKEPGKIFPCLNEYYKFLRTYEQTERESKKFDIEELSLMLERYAFGEYSFLLNSEENIDVTYDTLIGFDLESASKTEYFPIVILIVLNITMEKIKRRRGVKKLLIIDEALDFLLDKKMGEFIAHLYRTYRKKEGGIWIAAQNVNFIEKMPDIIRESVVGNSDIKIILDHRKYRESYPALSRTLSFTENDINMLDSIQTTDSWRQFMIKIGSHSFIFGNDVSDFADVAFDSRQKVIVEIENLFRETGSLPVAINQYLENKKKSITKL